jgi:archaellin
MKSKIVISFVLILSLLMMIIITTTVTSLINQENNTITDQNLDEMISNIYNDISTYVQIEHIYGKYCQTEHGRMITQIALQIKPYFSTEIPLDGIIIQIIGKQDVQTLYYSGNASTIMSHSLFNHPEWNHTNSTQFSIISIFDLDSSIEQNNLINDYTDRAYILIHLNEDQCISHTDHLELNVLFESGVNQNLNLQAPFSTHDIIQFY